MLAYVLLAQSRNPDPFIVEAEKALAIEPDLPPSVHQHLFQAYLQRDRDKDKDLAAAHLMYILSKEQVAIPSSSRLWLGSYFYDRLKAFGNEYLPEALPKEKERRQPNAP